MEVLPSIDVEGGRAVKRVRGARGTGLVLGDPVELAVGLRRAGARWIHVVDLDGAELGRPVNLHVVRALKDIGFMVQYGGGLRGIREVEEASSAGADRVIIGSAWASDPSFLEAVAGIMGPGGVLAALDERDGHIVHSGWRVDSGMALGDALLMLEPFNIAGYLYTQVDVEGTMKGPDVARVSALRSSTGKLLIYAGGISTVGDIVELCRAGVDGAVLGMALHSGAVPLGLALELAGRCR